MRVITNTETGAKHHFSNDDAFLRYVRAIYKENESQNPYPSTIHWLPENIYNAVEYIEEYCGDLQLNEDV